MILGRSDMKIHACVVEDGAIERTLPDGLLADHQNMVTRLIF